MPIITWKEALKNKKLMGLFIGGVFSSLFMLSIFRIFLIYNETRMGFTLKDPLLELFPPHDLTWFTFAMIHTFWISGVILILQNPIGGTIWGYSYALLLVFRIFTLYLLPLEPPPAMIFLHDPVVSVFTNTSTPVKDLFFSGHTATAFLIYLGVPNRKLKPLFLMASVVIGSCVLAQHVHYSLDVLAAPFFAYFAYKISNKFINSLL